MQDIPKIYTALAEWFACFVYILLLTKRVETRKLILIQLPFLLFLIILHYIIGRVPDIYWIPLMFLALFSMYCLIKISSDISFQATGYYWAIAFIAAEFIAAFQWQIYSFFFEKGYGELWFRYAMLVVFYGAFFILLYILQKKYMLQDIYQDFSYYITNRSAITFIIITLFVFLMSNLSYVYPDTPFSSIHITEIFNIRALVDFSGLVILFALQDRHREFQLEKELAATNLILYKQYQQYEQSKENIEIINQKYHDLKHQIEIIRVEADKGKRDSYLKQLEDDLQMWNTQTDTGNTVLDTILTGKNLFCAQNDIRFTCMADGSLLSFMNTMDICSVFGNILDNAIESVISFEATEKRIIRLNIFSKNGLLMIHSENYSENILTMKNHLPISTKNDKVYHGFGLKSIQKTISKYNGAMRISLKDNWFYLTISIPIQ